MIKYKFLFFLILNLNSFSQNNEQLWTRLNIISNFNKNLSLSNELNLRTQSQLNAFNLFEKPLANVYRIWINYKINNNNLIHFSPFAFFKNYKINNFDPLNTKVINEYRWQLQWENQNKTNQNIFLNTRFGIEHRIFEEKDNLIRLRIREGIMIDINQYISFFLHDEFMINLNRLKTENVFDQNRITFQSNFKISKLTRFELGTFINTTYDLSNNHIFFANLHLSIN